MSIDNNKKRIWKYRDRILKMFFEEWRKATLIAETFWFNFSFMSDYLENSKGTKEYTYPNWKTVRRCIQCKTYKEDTNFRMSWLYRFWTCMYCEKLHRKNKRIISKNTWIPSKDDLRKREHYHRNSLRINTKRKMMRLIKYTDRTWKILIK